ncbi:MAG: NAD(P)H-dependent oxidoreductase subunit E, partial [Pseudomonadota bacterium]
MPSTSTASEQKNKRLGSAAELAALQQSLLEAKDPNQREVVVCYGTGCLAAGATQVEAALKKGLAEAELDVKVRPLIKTTGCRGFCSRGPLVVVLPDGLFYQRVTPADVAEIIQTTIVENKPVERLLYTDPQSGEPIPLEQDIPFYQKQKRLVLGRMGSVDPTDIMDTIAAGGYQALAKVITSMEPEAVVSTMERSGLRGRGGAGFPTGRKWRSALKAIEKKGRPVYVVCNGDEGDPGAFMDCMVMEGDPHAVIEGMIIGAYALGANQGYIYVRAEYPVAIKHLGMAMEQARAMGLLGENILGSGFDFDIQINRGAGAFVCGESTALFTSLEGRAGEPRPKYVRSVEEGL